MPWNPSCENFATAVAVTHRCRPRDRRQRAGQTILHNASLTPIFVWHEYLPAMIHYQLCCDEDHAFDGWFKDSAAFDTQAKRGLVACPQCASTAVRRALMAPSITRPRARSKPFVPGAQDVVPVASPAVPKTAELNPLAPMAGAAMPDQVRAMLQRVRAEIEAKCEHVGNRFAEEARAIHRGETEARGIYGEATPEQAESLADEGIEIASIPWLPRADG